MKEFLPYEFLVKRLERSSKPAIVMTFSYTFGYDAVVECYRDYISRSDNPDQKIPYLFYNVRTSSFKLDSDMSVISKEAYEMKMDKIYNEYSLSTVRPTRNYIFCCLNNDNKIGLWSDRVFVKDGRYDVESVIIDKDAANQSMEQGLIYLCKLMTQSRNDSGKYSLTIDPLCDISYSIYRYLIGCYKINPIYKVDPVYLPDNCIDYVLTVIPYKDFFNDVANSEIHRKIEDAIANYRDNMYDCIDVLNSMRLEYPSLDRRIGALGLRKCVYDINSKFADMVDLGLAKDTDTFLNKVKAVENYFKELY